MNADLAQGALQVGLIGSVLQMRRLRLRGEWARLGSLRGTARTRTQSVELPRPCSVAPQEGTHRGQAQRLSETGVPCPLLRTPGSRGPGPRPFPRLALAAPQMWLLVRRGSSSLPSHEVPCALGEGSASYLHWVSYPRLPFSLGSSPSLLNDLKHILIM